MVRIICIVTGDINLPQRRCCATFNMLYSWQWHVTQQNTQNALLCFHCKTVTRTHHNVKLYVHCLSCSAYQSEDTGPGDSRLIPWKKIWFKRSFFMNTERTWGQIYLTIKVFRTDYKKGQIWWTTAYGSSLCYLTTLYQPREILNVEWNYDCKISGSHGGTASHSRLLGSYVASTGKQLPRFQRTVVTSVFKGKHSKKNILELHRHNIHPLL